MVRLDNVYVVVSKLVSSCLAYAIDLVLFLNPVNKP